MRFKALFIATLAITSVCSASMHAGKNYVKKSIDINLEEISFKPEGMFLMIDPAHGIKLTKLTNDQDNYIAFYRVDYICGDCQRTYRERPAVCDCGSDDIREREIDLWPVG